MKEFFTAGIFFLIGLVSFAGAYFFKRFLANNMVVGVTLLIVAITLVKMLEIRDGMFS
jgi:hypothetical protein